MKVLYVAPYCFGLEESMANSFRKAGCELEPIIYGKHSDDKSKLERLFFDRFGYGVVRQAKKIAQSLGLLDRRVMGQLHAFNNRILEAHRRFRPDLVFMVKGDMVLADTLKEIKSSGSRLVAYYWDDPFLRFAQDIGGTDDPRFRNARNNCALYETTFVYDPSYVPELQKHGVKNAHYLMDWYEPELYSPMQISSEEQAQLGADVAFVGSPYENRVQALAALEGFHVGIWGPIFRWKEYFAKHPFIEKSYRGEAAGLTTAKIYNASKINLNIHDTAQCKESVNNRTFQILACKGFEILDEREKAHELFEIGKELETFKSGQDLRDKVAYYLENSARRDQIREKGYLKSGLHSADQRVSEILRVVGNA